MSYKKGRRPLKYKINRTRCRNKNGDFYCDVYKGHKGDHKAYSVFDSIVLKRWKNKNKKKKKRE